MPEDVSWSHFFSDSKKRFSEFTYSIFAGHYFICHLWPTNWNFSLHFCQSYPESRCVICTGVTLFAPVLNFLHWCYIWTSLLSANQNWVIFLCIITKVYVAFTPAWVFIFTHFWYLLMFFSLTIFQVTPSFLRIVIITAFAFQIQLR